ncbi:MAG: antitoxin family protein [Dehalococcoidia bacterium]|nr:antitoxin family protein [Dehalococcoidia bacterium]
MIANVKARFSKGALMPIEPLDLEEGAEVTLRIVNVASANPDSPSSQQPEEDRSADTGTHPVIAMIDRLRAEIPELEQETAPTDGAKNYKHYLYGFPKEE